MARGSRSLDPKIDRGSSLDGVALDFTLERGLTKPLGERLSKNSGAGRSSPLAPCKTDIEEAGPCSPITPRPGLS
eukprot:9488146-Pyramimonas_sp.AAC.1